MIPLMMSWMAPMMEGDPQRFDDHPELVMRSIAPMMSNIMVFMAVLAFVWLMLVGAAVVRRLHDGDRPGWWAAPVFALPVVMPLVYIGVMPKFFETFGTIRPGMTPDQINAQDAADDAVVRLGVVARDAQFPDDDRADRVPLRCRGRRA